MGYVYRSTKHDQMRLQKITKIIESHRCHQNVVLCWLIEVIFLLEFYYLYLLFISIYIHELSWKHDASMSKLSHQ